MALSLTTRQLQFYTLLQGKLGAETAEAFVSLLDERVKGEFDNATTVLATKEDIHKLRVDMAEQKVDIIKWMVSIAFGMAVLIIGLYFK